MSGNHSYVGRQLRRDLFRGGDHALDAAAARHVNKRKAVTHEIVAHVHNIVLREEDNGIAVGVPGRKMQRANVLAVQVHGHVVLEGDNRQGVS